jgi:hypothetical protein
VVASLLFMFGLIGGAGRDARAVKVLLQFEVRNYDGLQFVCLHRLRFRDS